MKKNTIQKNKMIKNLICCLLICVTIFNNGFAIQAMDKILIDGNLNNNDYKITDFDGLDNAIKIANRDGKISKTEEDKIKNSTDPDILSERINDEINALNDAMTLVKNSDLSIDYDEAKYDAAKDKYTQTKSFDLKNDYSFSVTVTDQKDESNFLSCASIPNGKPYTVGYLPKDYGRRLWTANYQLKINGNTCAILWLNMYFDVGTFGLKAISCDYSKTSASFPLTISSVSGCKITDSKAEKVGYDINCEAMYKVTSSIQGEALNTFYLLIQDTVKLEANIKSEKCVIVSGSTDIKH